MPPDAIVQLSEVGSSAVTATSGSQLSSKDVDHAAPTSVRWTGARFRVRVHRAHLDFEEFYDLSNGKSNIMV